MQTLAAGLDHFKARGLADHCFVMWTVDYAEGPSHAFQDVPHIIWGNGGGFLKQGQCLDAAARPTTASLNTLISAALQDTAHSRSRLRRRHRRDARSHPGLNRPDRPAGRITDGERLRSALRTPAADSGAAAHAISADVRRAPGARDYFSAGGAA